jgi:hypothetical protein
MFVAFRLCRPDGKIDESVRMDLYDYGPQAGIATPAPSQVTDISDDAISSSGARSLNQLHC